MREGHAVPQYMVERHLEGFPAEQLPGAAAAAKAKAAELTAEGQDVAYVRSTWLPQDEKCFCLFEAESETAVEEVQRRAGLPYAQIHEAAFLTADQV